MTLKPRSVIRTQASDDDLYRIRLHLEDTAPDTAYTTILDLNRKIHDIAGKGLTGSKRLFLPDHIKAFPYKKHCFYFTVNNGTLTLLRVLAQKQDTADIIFEADET